MFHGSSIYLFAVLCLALAVSPSVQAPRRSNGSLPHNIPCSNLFGRPFAMGLYTLRPNATFSVYDLLNVLANGYFPRLLTIPGLNGLFFNYVNETTFFGISSYAVLSPVLNFTRNWLTANGFLAQTYRTVVTGTYQFVQSKCITPGLTGRSIHLVLGRVLPNATQTAKQLLQIVQNALFSFYQNNSPGFRVFGGIQTDPGSLYDFVIYIVSDTAQQRDIATAQAVEIIAPLGVFEQASVVVMDGQVIAQQGRLRRGYVQVPFNGS